MIGLSVTEAVYQHEGKPPVDKPVVFDREVLCGTCRKALPGAPANRILTSQFGSWDAVVPDPVSGTRWLCAPCAWAWRATAYRRRATIIRKSEGAKGAEVAVAHPNRAELVEALTGPIQADVAICVPLSGKKAVLPTAQWGRLASDATTLLWTSRDLRYLRSILRLRNLGTGEADLREPSPPYYLLAKTDPCLHEDIARLWEFLQPIRENKVLFPLFLHLSRKDKAS